MKQALVEDFFYFNRKVVEYNLMFNHIGVFIIRKVCIKFWLRIDLSKRILNALQVALGKMSMVKWAVISKEPT